MSSVVADSANISGAACRPDPFVEVEGGEPRPAPLSPPLPSPVDPFSTVGRLATTVAHEFNNVLMGMQPFAELLQREPLDPVVAKKAAAHIASSIERGRRVATEILRFARPTIPAIEAVELASWWDRFAPELLTPVGDSISVEVDLERGIRAKADPLQLVQVVSNLLLNASTAMVDGGTISIGARYEPDGPAPRVRLTVRDSGPGMSADVASRAFEPFFTTKRIGGTGLGLPIARQIMETHGGEIRLETAPGNGCRFDILFAVADEPAMKRAEPEDAVDIPAGIRILIVEDEPSIREGLEGLLEAAGAVIFAVGSGADALELQSRVRPDLVVLDIGLPDIDGIEVFHRMRCERPDLGVIFATGHGDQRMLSRVGGGPRIRFLQKPFEYSDLARAVKSLLPIRTDHDA